MISLLLEFVALCIEKSGRVLTLSVSGFNLVICKMILQNESIERQRVVRPDLFCGPLFHHT